MPTIASKPALFQQIRHTPKLAVFLSAALLLLIVIAALGIGAVGVRPLTILYIMLEHLGIMDLGHAGGVETSIIVNIRLPRVLLGATGGALLAITGMLMQTFFRNPLADPALIGVATGGALGAVTMIVIGATFFAGLSQLATMFALPTAAFIGSLGAGSLVFVLSRHDNIINVTTMLLCGIAVNAIAGAGIGLMSFMADDAQLRDITFWSLGSLGAAGWWQVGVVSACLFLILVVTSGLMGGLNALLLGDGEAHHLGYSVERLKIAILLLTCLGAGAVVAVCGVIGFIGLIAPHLSRLLVGPGHHYALPLSGFLGASLLTSADIVARIAVTPAELPIGILTAFIGGPVFLWLLRQKQKGSLYVSG